MRVAYIAKHGSGGNDDEGAVAHALRSLGHDVFCFSEQKGVSARAGDYDLALFHKWDDWRTIATLRDRTKTVFWWFDLVEDPWFQRRSDERREWMLKAMSRVTLGFMSDGDWVQKNCGKYPVVKLSQGADERVLGRWMGDDADKLGDFLYVGNVSGPRGGFVERLRARLGDRLTVVRAGVYGRDMAELVHRHTFVIAPPTVVTDRYWSNRVYVMAGFGATILHPYSSMLEREYHRGEHIVYYKDEAELLQLVDLFSSYEVSEDVAATGKRALARTCEAFTYRHRVQELLRKVAEHV